MRLNRLRPIAVLAAALVLVGAVAACTRDADKNRGRGPFTFTAMDPSGTVIPDALKAGDIDVGVLLSSDASLVRNRLVALEDDKHLQPIDNVIPAVHTASSNPGVEAALDAVSEALTSSKVREMVAAVTEDDELPEDVAADFLEDVDVPAGATGDLTVAGGDLLASTIVGRVYALALSASGANVTFVEAGPREVSLPRLESGEIDVMPELVSAFARALDERYVSPTDLDEAAAAARALAAPRGITLLEPAPATIITVFVVTQGKVNQYNLRTVSDLAKVNDALIVGGPSDCPERVTCVQGLIERYKVDFRR